MRLPVVVDTDLGADDILALAMLLRDPSVDVRAVTLAGTGLVRCVPGVRHVREMLAAFARPRVPVGCGRDDAGRDGLEFPSQWRDTSDAFYGLDLRSVSRPPPRTEAVSVLAAAIGSSPSKTTVVALGPWTNLEDLLRRRPNLRPRIAKIHAMAGAVDVRGNVPVGGAGFAEWNVRADPSAFAAGLRSGIPIMLVPLDATRRVPLTSSFFERLGRNRRAAGARIGWELLSRNPFLLRSDQYLWDELAAASVNDPSLLRLAKLRLRVETAGVDAGRLRRDPFGTEVTVGVDADGPRAVSAIVRGLQRGAPVVAAP